MNKFLSEIKGTIQNAGKYLKFSELFEKEDALSARSEIFEAYKKAIFETDVYLRGINEKLGCQAKSLDTFDLIYQVVEDVEGKLFSTEEEKTLSVSVGFSQHSAEESCCGDTFDSFTVGKNFYSVLCDGMGRGKRAYVSSTVFSTLLSRLLLSGVGAETAISLAICAYRSLDLDETFTTLDLLSVNLSTGEGKILKYGACDSYIFSDTCRFVPSGGYPIGILNDTSVCTYSFKFKPGDILIMMSDGAETLPQIVISNCIKTDFGNGLEDLCQTLISHCREKTDDVTVAAIVFNKIS